MHGDDGLSAAKRITEALFSGQLDELSAEDYEQLALDGLPSSTLADEDLSKPLTTLLAEAGMVKAGREVKDALGRNAVIVNGDAKSSEDNMKAAECFARDRAKFERFFLVKLGRKKHHLFKLA